jgi:hypothetical protein
MIKFKKPSGFRDEGENNSAKVTLDDDISIHIFSTSATMVGVCLTVIGIFKAIIHLKAFDTFGDDILSVDALLFLAACVLSYISLRTRTTRRRHYIEKIADGIFLTALFLMALACGLITYSVI